jgi:hypothetical protein
MPSKSSCTSPLVNAPNSGSVASGESAYTPESRGTAPPCGCGCGKDAEAELGGGDASVELVALDLLFFGLGVGHADGVDF